MVEPLYNESRETLLKRARIESASDEQTIALVDQTITEVRMGFYRTLGKARASTIAAYTLVANPDSTEEILRATGANTEALWLTWLLAQRLPYLFMDNRGSTGDVFNDEQLTRDSSGLKEFLQALKAQIDVGLGDMQDPEATGTGFSKGASIGPDDMDLVFKRFRGLYPHGTEVTLNATY